MEGMESGFNRGEEIVTGGGASDGKVKVSASDTSGYLEEKVEGGTGVIVIKKDDAIELALDARYINESEPHVIQDEGEKVLQRPNLNFVGASVEITDDAANEATVVTIDNLSPGHQIELAGNAQPQRSALNFIGQGITMTDDTANDATVVTFGGVPDVTNNDGLFLTTDGTNTSWASPFPSQTNNTGKFLQTDGSALSWTTAPAKHIIAEEGGALTARDTLDFVGAGVTVTDDAGNNKTIVTVAGGGHAIQDEGSATTARANLNFVGQGVTVTDDSLNDTTIVTVPGSGLIPVYSDSASVNATAGNVYLLNGTTTLNLPTGTNGDRVGVADYGNTFTNAPLVIVRSGTDTITGDGLTSYSLTNNGGCLTLAFWDGQWTVTNSDTLPDNARGLLVVPATAATVNAVMGLHYVCNGVTTLNLPTGVEGYSVGISDIGNTFQGNPITIVPNGSDYIGKPLQTSLTLDRDMSCVVLGFTNGVWSFLSAESFNDLGASSDGTSGVSDGDKGDVIVSSNGTVWSLDASGVVASSYEKPALTIDDKGRITGATEKQITLSSNVTWYVATDGNANADGLTIGNPITLEEAASRVNRVVPTDTNFTITIEIADGSYTYANSYVFVAPPTEFSFAIKLHGQDWVGVNAYPTANISTKLVILINFKRYCYIENIHYESLIIDNCSCDILNVASANFLHCKEYNGYIYVYGTYKFSNSGNYAFSCTNGYIDIDVTTFDSGGTTRNYTQGFIRIGHGGALYLYNNVITTGTFTGKKIDFINNSAILDGGEEYIASLPGDVMPTYPNYLFTSSNTFATTASLATVATSGSYNDLSNLPTLGTSAALDVGTGANNVVQLDGTGKLPAVDGSLLTNLPTGDTAVNITIDTTNFNNNLSGTDTTVQVALETLDDITLGTAAALDVGTGANNVVQLDGSGNLPALNGSALTGVAIVVSPPATASSTGTAGQIAYDASYIYICTATDTWLRASIATW